MLCQTSDSDFLDLFPPAHPPRPQISRGSALMLHIHPFPIPPLCFHSLFLFCYLVLDLSTIFAPTPYPLVLADATAATFNLPGPPPLVLAEAAAAAVFAPAPLPLVLAEAAAAIVFALASLPLVLAEEPAADAVFAVAPPPPVLAEAAAAAVFGRRGTWEGVPVATRCSE